MLLLLSFFAVGNFQLSVKQTTVHTGCSKYVYRNDTMTSRAHPSIGLGVVGGDLALTRLVVTPQPPLP